MTSANPHWESIASLVDSGAANHLAELLQAELIPSRVVNAKAKSAWDVQVPSEQVATAQRLMESSHVTEAERKLLAGKSDGRDG